MFSNLSHNQGRAFKVHRAREAGRKLSAFAEMLAEGTAPETAAVRLGHRPEYGRVLLGRIREKLGSQAR